MTNRFRLAFLTVLLIVLAAFATPGASAHSDQPGEGYFHFTCTVVVPGAQIDPLVFPGTVGTSHVHQFVGNRSINENSTNASLRANPATSCMDDTEEKQDPSTRKYANAIWYPRFYENGTPLTANRVTSTYTVGASMVRDFAAIQPFVDDMDFIAGSSAGGAQQINGQFVYKLLCPTGTSVPGNSTTAPLCAAANLRVIINAPDCWDGVRADAANHKDHMAYSRKLPGATLNTCPSTHPVLVPAHMIKIELPTRGGSALTVATGSGAGANTNGNMSTLHYDYMSAVVAEVDGSNTRTARTRECLNENEYCGGTAHPVPGEGGGI